MVNFGDVRGIRFVKIPIKCLNGFNNLAAEKPVRPKVLGARSVSSVQKRFGFGQINAPVKILVKYNMRV